MVEVLSHRLRTDTGWRCGTCHWGEGHRGPEAHLGGEVAAHYSVSQDTRETCVEEVSCDVPAHTKLTIVVRWKRIWQHGLVQITQGGLTLRIPFRIAVAMTFDQEQIDQKGTNTSG